ncbi:MAG: hypothetical protein V8R91_13995 [Butyricimonas faecihominis]
MEIIRQHIENSQHRTRMIVNDTLTIRHPLWEKTDGFFLFLNPGLYVDGITTPGTSANFDLEKILPYHYTILWSRERRKSS